MTKRPIAPTLAVTLAVTTLGIGGCGGAVARQPWENTFTGSGDDAFLVDDDFVCLDDARWDVVGGTRVWNALGRQGQAVDHARQHSLGSYPVGTVIQIFADEASVKRGRGFSPETGDWEFLVLDVSSGETVITQRGTTEVKNAAGTCLSCHGAAQAFDYACFTNSSCAPLPFFIDTTVVPEDDDPRCR
jgi:hypothetical protein